MAYLACAKIRHCLRRSRTSTQSLIVLGIDRPVSIPTSSAARNFVLEGLLNDVVSPWCFCNSWKLIQSTSTCLCKLASGFHGIFGLILAAPLIPTACEQTWKDRASCSELTRGESRGGNWAIAPPKTYESNFIRHDFCRIRKTAFAI